MHHSASDMVIKSFTDEQLNFCKFSTLVVDEFPKALRQTFKHMWENVGPGSNWDDSEGVRDSFLTKGEAKPKFPQTSPTRTGIAPRCSKPLSTRKLSLYPIAKVTSKLLVSCTLSPSGLSLMEVSMPLC